MIGIDRSDLIPLFIVFGAIAAVTFLFAFALGRPRLAPARRILAQSRFKLLAYAIPFSPGVTVLMLQHQFRGGFLLPMGTPLALLLTSISSAALAACWLCLPDDPARRIRAGYAMLLAVVLWLLDVIAIISVLIITR